MPVPVGGGGGDLREKFLKKKAGKYNSEPGYGRRQAIYASNRVNWKKVTRSINA